MDFMSQVARTRLDGSEALLGLSGPTVIDYWRWAYSDILENTQRGIFAEFLVASALGITAADRVGWNGYDLDYGGYKIEVKSSAYLQSWLQRQHSKMSFRIGARQQWIEGESTYEDARYVADCFVFALFGDRDPLTANVIDAAHWEFFVVPIDGLIQHVGAGKSISEARLREMTTSSVRFGGLRERIDRTRVGELFVRPAPLRMSGAEHQRTGKIKTYLVARRKTRENGILVVASNAPEAQLLARADATIASFGTNISAISLSGPQIKEALRDGVIDLRSSVTAVGPDGESRE